MKFKVFDIYDMDEVEVSDSALVPYLNLDGRLVVKSQGKNSGKFSKAKVHILERLATRIAVPGHVGKKHKRMTGWACGKFTNNMNIVLKALEIVEKRKKENPIQILVRAIENCSPRDETTTIEYGGARYPQAVDVSPLRRVNLALKHIVHGASDKAFNKKKNIVQSLAEEIILASENNGESFAVRKRNESEKQADSAR